MPAAALVLEAAQLVRDVALCRCACITQEMWNPVALCGALAHDAFSRFEACADGAAPGAQESSVRRGEADDDELPDAQESAVAEDARRVRCAYKQRALIQVRHACIALLI